MLPEYLQMIRHIENLLQAKSRVILGLTGPPGAGKSTVAAKLSSHFWESSVVLPLDGFHYTNAVLKELNLSFKKGAPETFDVAAYVNLLRRAKGNLQKTLHAPKYCRSAHEPITGSVAIPPSVSLIITEGNYLLLDDAWGDINVLLDECWFIDSHKRRERLIARHMQFGKTSEEAYEWFWRVDEPNADLVYKNRKNADRLFRID